MKWDLRRNRGLRCMRTTRRALSGQTMSLADVNVPSTSISGSTRRTKRFRMVIFDSFGWTHQNSLRMFSRRDFIRDLLLHASPASSGDPGRKGRRASRGGLVLFRLQVESRRPLRGVTAMITGQGSSETLTCIRSI